MTVSLQTPVKRHTANGVSTVFAYDYLILDAADLGVYLDDASQSSGFTVSGVGTPTGGNVTFTTAPASGTIVTLIREMLPTRSTNYANSGDFKANTVNPDFDRTWLYMQQLAEKIGRAPLLSLASMLVDIAFPAPGAGQYLRWNNAGTNLETAPSVVSNGTFLQSGTGAVEREANAKMGESVSVKDYGAIGNGLADDTDAIQAAIDYIQSAGGGSVIFPRGTYAVRASKGTNDKWGINISSSKVQLIGEYGTKIVRLNPVINSYSTSYPLLLIGTPDSNDPLDQISNINVKNINFEGSDTRHSTSGNALMDGRQAIWVKNSKKVRIHKCDFTKIDSSAIYIQKPGEYDYENSTYYNLTKCYNVKIVDCDFDAEEHAIQGRALLHAIVAQGDDVKVIDCDFLWCDDAVASTSTYDEYSDSETDTFTNPNLGVAVKRSGRGLTITGNTITNSSEHALYLESMGVSCTGNTIVVNDAAICNAAQIQLRARQATVTGNTLTGVAMAGSIAPGSMDVVWNNTVTCVSDTAAGVINVQSQGLKAYIDARPHFASYKPMQNITVSGTINMPSTAQTLGIGVRLYTDTSDASFPNGQMINVKIDATINYAMRGIYFVANMARNVDLNGAILNGKPFTEAGFSTGTTMNSLCALAVHYNQGAQLQSVSMRNCRIKGFEYICREYGGSPGAGTILAPHGITCNVFDYIKYWATAGFVVPTQYNMFSMNRGTFFLDRNTWYSFWSFHNSLYDGATATTDRKSMIQIVGAADIRLYYDDAGGYKAL